MANNTCDSDDMKFCLGGDVFLSITFWNGLHRAHIRKFRSVPDEHSPGKFKVYPSNTGIMLTPENLKMLRPLIPRCLSVLDKKQQQQQQQTLSSSSSPVSTLSSECPCNNPVLMMVDSDVTQPPQLPLTQCPPKTMSTSAAAAAAVTTIPATASAASGSALPTDLDSLPSSQLFFADQGNCYSYLKKLNNKKANKIWSLKCKKERL